MADEGLRRRLLTVEAVQDAHSAVLHALIQKTYPTNESRKAMREEICGVLESIYEKVQSKRPYVHERLQRAIAEIERMYPVNL